VEDVEVVGVGLLRRNDWEFKQRGKCGLWVSDLFPHIAAVADELTVIRSMRADSANHTPATYQENSGFRLNGFPALGSWLSYGLGAETDDLPAWIAARWPEEARPITGTLHRHAVTDLGASIASGSQRWDGMVVVPCSMKTLSGIARGAAGNLIERAADVTLKERRPLVLVPRETPLHLIHLDNLRAVALAGAVLVPAMPAFYQKPQRLEDLADFVAARVLQVLGMPQQLVPVWEG